MKNSKRLLVVSGFASLSLLILGACQSAVIGSRSPANAPAFSTYRDLTLLGSNVDAYREKRRVIDEAKKSIDMSYFIFDDDPSSAQIILDLMKKADQLAKDPVTKKNPDAKIRILVDYFMTQNQIATLRLLDKYKSKIEVKRFRPPTGKLIKLLTDEKIIAPKFILGLMANNVAQIKESVAPAMVGANGQPTELAIEIQTTLGQLKANENISLPMILSLAKKVDRFLPLLKELRAFLRKAHHKLLLADGECFVMGGRNISDEYHADSGDVLLEKRSYAFRDTDISGCVSNDDQKKSFNRLWSSPQSVTLSKAILTVDGKVPAPKTKKTLIAAAQKAAHVAQKGLSAAALGLGNLDGRLLENLPMDVVVDAKQGTHDITTGYLDRIRAATSKIDIVSAYFCVDTANQDPRLNEIYTALADKAARGVAVTIYTNSITTTDLNMVNLVAYTKYADLVKAGVRIKELADGQGSLHTKAAAFDDDYVLIGSYNMDPRSHLYDTNNLLELFDPGAQAKTASKFRQARIDAIRWVDADLVKIKGILELKVKDVKTFSAVREML